MARLIDKDEAILALEMMEKYDDGYILADHQEILERLREIEYPEQKWISVKDRIPEKMEWVLCACRGNIIEVLRYDHIMDDWDTTMPNRGYFKNFVTHWMPLPEPPKDGE